jgi:hypothetical protein
MANSITAMAQVKTSGYRAKIGVGWIRGHVAQWLEHLACICEQWGDLGSNLSVNTFFISLVIVYLHGVSGWNWQSLKSTNVLYFSKGPIIMNLTVKRISQIIQLLGFYGCIVIKFGIIVCH